MRQPDTSALRERLNNYTPGQELEQDKQELEGLLQEVSDQIFATVSYTHLTLPTNCT